MAIPAIPDYSRPGERMQPLPLKIPPAAKNDLHAAARQIGCHPAALARYLLVSGLEGLTVQLQG